MAYKSILTAHRHKIMTAGAVGGALFSLISQLTFGVITVQALGASLLLGILEGLLIVSAGSLLDRFFPGLSVNRTLRMAGIFFLALLIHGLISAGIYWVLGMNTFFLAGIIALFSVLGGEWAAARERELLYRETETLKNRGEARLPAGFSHAYGLSPRETETAELLFARAAYKDIAEKLFVSLATVKSHSSAVYRKANVGTRREFIALVERFPQGCT